MTQAEKPATLNENQSRHLSIHVSSIIQTEERTERDALNEKPESRNLFICNEVCLSSIRESDERTGLDENSRLWKIFSSMTQAKKRMKR
jgi:hypothetical protein